MKKRKAPLVNINGLHDSTYPNPIAIGSKRWHDWLSKHKKFHFECGATAKFTAHKSTRGYWSAQRRVNGKLRHQYLGDSSSLDWDILEAAARKMDLGDSAYWRQIYSQSVEEDKNKSHTPVYETESQVTLQATAEIEQLHFKLDEAHQHIEQLEIACQYSQNRKLAAVELLNQFIEEVGVVEKIKHPGTNRTLGYLAKFQKWLEQLPSE
jgi:hypothetical protein